MMKKLFSLTLAMVTALGLMLPASAAEETTDEALARVTQAVKAALDLDTDAYDEFQGSWYEDGLTGAWDLYWSTELEEELSISALDDGTVISYDLGLPYTASNSGDFPVFPQGDEAAAARAAGDFLDKVLREGESVKLEEPRGMDILGGDSYRYSGVILLNGLPSPLTYSITVDAADNRVRSFHRTTAEDTFLGDVPSAAAAVRRDRAAKLLTDTLELKLEYVREAGGTSAVLRYLPVDTDTFYVDAATGALLNLTELEDQMGGWGAGGSADNTAAAESEDSGLSPAEQAGICGGDAGVVVHIQRGQKGNLLVFPTDLGDDIVDAIGFQHVFPQEFQAHSGQNHCIQSTAALLGSGGGMGSTAFEGKPVIMGWPDDGLAGHFRAPVGAIVVGQH